jgi:cysteinyl-tRNA synthetase
LRLLFLSSHYRSQQNFTWDSLAASQKSWNRLQIKVAKFKERAETNDLDELSQEAKNFKNKFFTHLENDLKTSEALAILWEVVASDLSALEKLSLLYDFDQVFSLNLREIDTENNTLDIAELSQEVRQLLIKRRKARKIEDWQKADILRKRLEDLGYKAIDTKEGQRVKKIS